MYWTAKKKKKHTARVSGKIDTKTNATFFIEWDNQNHYYCTKYTSCQFIRCSLVKLFTIDMHITGLINTSHKSVVFVSSVHIDYGQAFPVHEMNQTVNKVHRLASLHLQKRCMEFHGSWQMDVIGFDFWITFHRCSNEFESKLRAGQCIIVILFCFYLLLYTHVHCHAGQSSFEGV